MSGVIITTKPIFFPCTIYIRAMVYYIHLAKFHLFKKKSTGHTIWSRLLI